RGPPPAPPATSLRGPGRDPQQADHRIDGPRARALSVTASQDGADRSEALIAPTAPAHPPAHPAPARRQDSPPPSLPPSSTALRSTPAAPAPPPRPAGSPARTPPTSPPTASTFAFFCTIPRNASSGSLCACANWSTDSPDAFSTRSVYACTCARSDAIRFSTAFSLAYRF